MSSLTPIVIFVVGARITASSARETVERDRLAKLQLIEHEQEAKVVEKRVKLWDELAPRLNDMYAYFMYVGQWKELSAADIVKRKRETDKLVYAYRPFFSDVFFQAYLDFTKASFMPYGEWRKDARLNTSDFMRNDEEKDRFTEEDNRDEIHRAYYGMMKAAAAELGLAVSQPPRPKDPSGDAPR